MIMRGSQREEEEVLSSLTYQILLYFGGWYYLLYVISECLLLTYKAILLPYPEGNLISEIFLWIFLSGVEIVRIFLGKKGNLTEHPMGVMLSIALTAPSVMGVVYFLMWQTYIMRIEVVLSSVQLSLQGLQLLFAVFTCISFIKASQIR